MQSSDLVIVSNRGPVSFGRAARGGLEATKGGGGGLVSSVGPLIEGSGALWVAAAMSEGDREAAAAGVIDAEGFRVRSLAIDPAVYRMAYDVIANGTLWFLHHGLFDLSRRPHIDRRWREAWEGYRAYNQAFAEAVAESAPDDATVLVQDYHLALFAPLAAKQRPDLKLVHFSHTPFCGPNSIRVLPLEVAEELLTSMSTFRACGFHSERWGRAFTASSREVGIEPPPTFVAPLSPDVRDFEAMIGSDEAAAEREWLDHVLAGRRMILRVDRIELSKNILRGFLAYEDLLRSRPDLRGEVVFVALVYPSRERLPAYQAYRTEVETLAARINADFGSTDWQPVVLDTEDNFVRSAVALSRYDVLLVNPVKDGLNLVALEGALINRIDGVVALSRDAGAWDLIGGPALEVNPFDISGTAEVLGRALDMAAGERATRAADLHAAATRRPPRQWLDDQLEAARR
ncbi:MAG TPA: trehalose-6-phosphate synthase [Acidimicrobiales bacterium]|nr:trehalose-6-phosphate synthase [Acidimicrobiales bacterium]